MTAGSMLKSIELPEVLLLPEPAASRNGNGSLSQRLGRILAHPALDEFLTSNPTAESDLVTDARRLGATAYPENRITDRQSASWIDHSARDELHRTLLLLYEQHMKLPQDGVADYQFHPLCSRLMLELEAPLERDMLRRARFGYDLSTESLPAAPED